MALNVDAFLNTLTSRMRTLPVVILYVTEECNLQCVTCSYRKALPGELTLAEIRELAERLHAFGLMHIAFSGGEPLMRRDFPLICDAFRRFDIKETLLTNGLLLQKRLPQIGDYLSEIIVSIDGADGATHNAIRGVEAFDRILSGIRRALKDAPAVRVSLRTVVQRKNFRQLPDLVALGRSLGVHHVSFLAADVLTDAFGRKPGEEECIDSTIALDAHEAAEFSLLMEEMAVTHARDFRSGFIAQSPQAMLHIAAYFAALRGLRPFPRNVCNAPMVSAVITSTGAMRPCFFLPAMGNVRTSDVGTIVNSASARGTRKEVKSCTPGSCTTCVCTLHVSPAAALFGQF